MAGHTAHVQTSNDFERSRDEARWSPSTHGSTSLQMERRSSFQPSRPHFVAPQSESTVGPLQLSAMATVQTHFARFQESCHDSTGLLQRLPQKAACWEPLFRHLIAAVSEVVVLDGKKIEKSFPPLTTKFMSLRACIDDKSEWIYFLQQQRHGQLARGETRFGNVAGNERIDHSSGKKGAGLTAAETILSHYRRGLLITRNFVLFFFVESWWKMREPKRSNGWLARCDSGALSSTVSPPCPRNFGYYR